jgi:hypothetical protein
MSGRIWTDEEQDYLRRNYRRGAAPRIARQLGRSPQGVALKAAALGLRITDWPKGHPPADLLDYIRQHNAAGLLDTQITRRWNSEHPDRIICRRTLTYLRARHLGLPVNEEARLEMRREAYRKQMETLGVDSAPEMARRHHRRNAMREGWPVECGPLELRILRVMQDGQPRTRPEIAELIGHGHMRNRAFFKCRRNSKSASVTWCTWDCYGGRKAACASCPARATRPTSTGCLWKC